jgi:thioester reductase-like protein
VNGLLRFVVILGLALGPALTAVAAPGPRPMFGGLLRLLATPEIQQELKLEPAQIDRVQVACQEIQSRGQELFQAFGSLTPQERDRRFKTLFEEELHKVEEILDSKQEARFKQLGLQLEGIRAINRKEIADALKLTSEQRQRIKATVDGEHEAMKSAFDGFQAGTAMSAEQREEARRKFREVRMATEGRLTAILSDAQRKQFQAMQGAPFTFPRWGRSRPPRD